jgi:hypothetical protein
LKNRSAARVAGEFFTPKIWTFTMEFDSTSQRHISGEDLNQSRDRQGALRFAPIRTQPIFKRAGPRA